MPNSASLEAFANVQELVKPEKPPGLFHTIVTGTDLARPLPPIRFAVPHLGLAPGAPTMIMGFGFSGKTMMGQDLLLSVSAGLPLWDLYSVGQGPVLHIDCEQGSRVTQERYQRLAAGRGIALGDLGTNLTVAYPDQFNLEDDASFDELARMADGKQLVLIDSFRAAAAHVRENDSEARQPLDRMGRIADQTGATFIVIHHSKKGPGDGDPRFAGRGSGAIFDALGNAFVLDGSADGKIKVVHSKDRLRGLLLDDFHLCIERVGTGDDYGLRVRHLDREQLEQPRLEANPAHKSLILKLLSRQSFLGTRADLRRALVIGSGPFQLALSELLGECKVVQTSEKGHMIFTLGGTDASTE